MSLIRLKKRQYEVEKIIQGVKDCRKHFNKSKPGNKRCLPSTVTYFEQISSYCFTLILKDTEIKQKRRKCCLILVSNYNFWCRELNWKYKTASISLLGNRIATWHFISTISKFLLSTFFHNDSIKNS